MKINSKWITDLVVKLKTIKLLEDNIENLDDVLDSWKKRMIHERKIVKLDFIKIKNFCFVKDS